MLTNSVFCDMEIHEIPMSENIIETALFKFLGNSEKFPIPENASFFILLNLVCSKKYSRYRLDERCF